MAIFRTFRLFWGTKKFNKKCVPICTVFSAFLGYRLLFGPSIFLLVCIEDKKIGGQDKDSTVKMYRVKRVGRSESAKSSITTPHI